MFAFTIHYLGTDGFTHERRVFARRVSEALRFIRSRADVARVTRAVAL